MTIDYGIDIVKDDNSAGHAAIPCGALLLSNSTYINNTFRRPQPALTAVVNN